MVFLRRICSSHPGDGEQRGQSLAALTARRKGLDCFQPQSRQPVLRRNKLRIFRFRASAKAQSLRLFLLSPQSGHFVGAPIMAGHCVSKQIGQHDAACQGCPRRVSQPAVLSALLVIQLFGIVIPPPNFSKEHQKERCDRIMVAALLHCFLWCASNYSVVGRIICHSSHDNARTNVCQRFFAENFFLLMPLLDRIASTRNQYEDSGTSNLSKKTRSGS